MATYRIYRTSYGYHPDQYETEPPCHNCYLAEFKANPYSGTAWYIEIESLEELEKLQKELKNPVILSSNTIEIYDSYRE